MSSYLNELNESQQQAVLQIDGPVMIVAGPGSGKTRVLTYRIANMIEKGIDPFSIMSLTFTNKAAAEMRHRIEKICGNEARNIFMGTFHSVFARLLRIDAPKLGYPANFTIYDSQDSLSLLKTIIKELQLNDKTYKPNQVFSRISNAKNALISPKAYKLDAEIMSEDMQMQKPLMGQLYEIYAKRCFQSGGQRQATGEQWLNPPYRDGLRRRCGELPGRAGCLSCVQTCVLAVQGWIPGQARDDS